MEKVIDRNHTEALAVVKFLAAALPTEKSKNYEAMQFIFNDGTKTIATDGRHLHIAYTSTMLNPGYWTILSNTKSQVKLLQVDSTGYTFPNVERVIPEGYTEKLDIVSRDVNQMLFEIVTEIQAPINFHYVEPLNMAAVSSWKLFHSGDPKKSIKLEALTGRSAIRLHAIIMPMAVK